MIDMPAAIQRALSLALRPFREEVRVAWIFGSVARNEHTTASDIDLVVVGEVRLEKLVGPLRRVEVQLGREVQVAHYSAAEFHRRHARGNHFVRSLMAADAIFVVGGRNELEQVVAAGPRRETPLHAGGGTGAAKARGAGPRRRPGRRTVL